MPGRTHRAKPGEPECPAPDCRRPAGFATEHPGEGHCLRHASRPPIGPASPDPSPTSAECETGSDPLARRLTGERTNPSGDPTAVLRAVLGSAWRAGYPFEQAWAIGAEAALFYMTTRQAREWWDALDATERAWAEAYARRKNDEAPPLPAGLRQSTSSGGTTT